MVRRRVIGVLATVFNIAIVEMYFLVTWEESSGRIRRWSSRSWRRI